MGNGRAFLFGRNVRSTIVLRDDAGAFARRVASHLVLLALAVAATLLLFAPGSARAASGGYTIDGDDPDAGAAFYTDPSGNSSELGAEQGSTTKLGNIHDDVLPTLGYTSITPGQDLGGVYLDTRVDPNTGHVWLYFAFEREADSTGQVLFEFQQNARPAACDYTGASLTPPANAAAQNLIDTCNPWQNRADGDFALVFDTQGQSLEIVHRTFSGSGFGAGTELDNTVSEAAAADDGLFGEGAVDLTATIFGENPTSCFTVANVIPATITGNSDQADFKDVVLGDFSGTAISNCGFVRVTKDTDPEDGTGTFAYTLKRSDMSAIKYSGATTATGTLTFDGDSDLVSDLKTGTNYTLSEADPSPTYALQSISCTTDGTDYNVFPGLANFTVQASTITECTITNDLQTGSITVIKHVVNDNGGTATAGQFTMDLQDTDDTTFAGAESPGTTNTFVDGYAYDVTETGPAGYTASYSGDCDSTIEAGVTKTCTVTNTDDPAKLIVIKKVVNDNGGTLESDDFTLDSGGTDDSPDNFTGADSPGTDVTLDAGAYRSPRTRSPATPRATRLTAPATSRSARPRPAPSPTPTIRPS